MSAAEPKSASHARASSLSSIASLAPIQPKSTEKSVDKDNWYFLISFKIMSMEMPASRSVGPWRRVDQANCTRVSAISRHIIDLLRRRSPGPALHHRQSPPRMQCNQLQGKSSCLLTPVISWTQRTISPLYLPPEKREWGILLALGVCLTLLATVASYFNRPIFWLGHCAPTWVSSAVSRKSPSATTPQHC